MLPISYYLAPLISWSKKIRVSKVDKLVNLLDKSYIGYLA